MVRYLYKESQLEDDILEPEMRRRVTDACQMLEHDIDVEEPKMEVTLRLDTSVTKF